MDSMGGLRPLTTTRSRAPTCKAFDSPLLLPAHHRGAVGVGAAEGETRGESVPTCACSFERLKVCARWPASSPSRSHALPCRMHAPPSHSAHARARQPPSRLQLRKRARWHARQPTAPTHAQQHPAPTQHPFTHTHPHASTTLQLDPSPTTGIAPFFHNGSAPLPPKYAAAQHHNHAGSPLSCVTNTGLHCITGSNTIAAAAEQALLLTPQLVSAPP